MTFDKLRAINVNEHTEQKDGLTYLSWAWAWDEVKKTYPDAVYKVWKDEEGRPYIYDENLGYMCFTSVTIEGETLEMWLPVMDSSNKAMKSEPYEYKVKRYGKEETRIVKAATMFDINKTIMRCLVKNLAMFGLGLYIYAGEDVPQPDEDELATKSNKEYLKSECTKRNVSLRWILSMVGYDEEKQPDGITARQYADAVKLLRRGDK